MTSTSSSSSQTRSTPPVEQVAVYAGVGSSVATLERGSDAELDALSDNDPEMYTIHGVAIGGNDITVGQSGIKKQWPPDELRKAADTLEGQELVRQHQNDEEGTIGTVTKAEYHPGTGVLYEAEIAPHYEQVVKDIRAGILDVSPRIYHSHPDNLEEDEETGALIAENLRFDNLSIVADGASPSNTAIFGDSPVLSPGSGQAKAATASASAGEATGDIVTAVLSQGRPDATTVAETLEGAQFSQGDWVEWDTRNSTEIGKVTGTYHKGDDMPDFRGSRGYSPKEGEHLYGLRMYKKRDGTWHPIEGGVIGHYEESVRSHDEPENVSDSSVELEQSVCTDTMYTVSELAEPEIMRPTDGDMRLLIHTPSDEMDAEEMNRIKTLIDDELGLMPDMYMTNEGVMFEPISETASGKHEHKHMHLDVMESAVDNTVGIDQKSTLFAAGDAGSATVQPCYVTSEEFSQATRNEIARLLKFVAGVSGNVYYHDGMLMIDTGQKQLSHTALDVAEILVRRMGDANGIDVTANRFRIGRIEEMGDSNTASHSVADGDWVQWYPSSGPEEAHGKVERIDEPADQSEETKAVMTMYMQDDEGVWHPTDHTKKLPVSEVEGWGNYPTEDAISSEQMMAQTHGMVRPGMMFFSRMNDSLLRVQDVTGDVVTMMSVGGDSSWKESRQAVIEKVGEQSWRQVHPDSSLYRMMVRDSEMSYGSSSDSEEMMQGSHDSGGLLHSGMMFFSQINDSLLRITGVKDDTVMVASVDHDAQWKETRDDVIDKIADDDWKYIDPDSSLYQMSDARTRMSDSMSASSSYGYDHGMSDKPMPMKMKMKTMRADGDAYGHGHGHKDSGMCPHCQSGGSCPHCEHDMSCPSCDHSDMGGPEYEMEYGEPETPQWREGQLVQWQVEPDLFGKIVHVDHERKIVMVAIHDKVGTSLKDTGFTISAGYSDLTEYNPTAESMAYGGDGHSDVPDDHIFENKEDAMELAKEMGLDGVHQMDGMYMPGETHSDYEDAVESMAYGGGGHSDVPDDHLFENKEDAMELAKEMGLDGVHQMDGMYMPGETHGDYEDAVESMSDYDSDTYDVPDYHYFESKSDAMEKATELGLEGVHTMGDMYMPGRSHHRYISAVEDDELAMTSEDAGAVMQDVMAGHKFDSKEDAMDKAEDMGLDGVHQMDGKYMPGESHEAYREALENQDEMSTSQLASEARKGEGSGDTDAEPEKSLSDSQKTALKNKVEEHNDEYGDEDGKKVTYSMLRDVYKRGIGAYQDSHRPGMTPQQWSLARVNAFLYLVRNGNPENDNYTQDNDLLPEDHSKHNPEEGEENARAPFSRHVAELEQTYDVEVPIEYDDIQDGMLEEPNLPNEGYEPHYLFARDTKSASSYPVVDDDGSLRRGNVDAAWNLRSTVRDSDDYEMDLETFEKMLLNLNTKFDDKPIDPSDAMALDVEEMNRYTASMDELDDVYEEWSNHVNMTASELETWSEHECANEASLKPEEVRERNMNLLETNKSDWTEDEIADAKKTISFISRMSVEENEPGNPMGPTDECPSEWLISLLNWAHNPYDSLPDEPKSTDEMSAFESEFESESVSVDTGDASSGGKTITVATTGDASNVTGLRFNNDDGTTDGDEMNTSASSSMDTSSRPRTVASLASDEPRTRDESRANRSQLQSEQTSAFTMQELTYDTADEDTLEEMSEPVVVEQDELDELHEKASQSEMVEDELANLTERVESMSEAADILDAVSDEELSTLKESDDPVIMESEEQEELESLVDEVASVYAEELAQTSTVLTAEELKSEFAPTTLREKFEQTDATMTGDINESSEPDPKGGAVESEELSQSSSEQEQEEELEDARTLVADELESAGWERQAEKMREGEIPVEPYLE